MYRQLIIFFLLIQLGCISAAVAQHQIPFIKLIEFDERLANGGDTTFVVNLWATWCAPCVAEIPYFEQLQEVYANGKIKVILLSLDAPKNRERVTEFFDNRSLLTDVFVLDERNQQQYIDQISEDWSGVIPATLFVNRAKGIRFLREQQFDFEELEKVYLSIIDH